MNAEAVSRFPLSNQHPSNQSWILHLWERVFQFPQKRLCKTIIHQAYFCFESISTFRRFPLQKRLEKCAKLPHFDHTCQDIAKLYQHVVPKKAEFLKKFNKQALFYLKLTISWRKTIFFFCLLRKNFESELLIRVSRISVFHDTFILAPSCSIYFNSSNHFLKTHICQIHSFCYGDDVLR